MTPPTSPPPAAAHCPNCWQTFPDIWSFKAHQDDCPGPSGRGQRSRRHHPATDEQTHLDDQDADNPRDPDAERAENARMFRAEVTAGSGSTH